MSREIKFRAWLKPRWDDDDEADKMYYDVQNSYDTLGDVKPYDIMDSFDGWLDDDVAIVEQYTGLKDKNGKEIYEGDVVKYLSYRKDYIGQVVFDFVDDSEGYYIEKHYGWGIYRDGYNTSLGDYADDNMRCELVEVIGNIHENPELLENK